MNTKEKLDYARNLLKKHLFKEAIELYKELFEEFPTNKVINYELALSILADSIETADINEFRNAEGYFLPLIMENDIYIIKKLADSYIIFGEFKKARKLLLKLLKMQENKDFALFKLAKLEQLLSNDKAQEQYLKQLNEIKDSKYYLLGVKKLMNFYIKMKDYVNAEKYFYELVKNNYYKNNTYRQKTVKLFLDYMQNRKLDTNFLKNSYFANQLVNYSKKAAIRHINKHRNDTINDGKTYFLDDINIAELFDELTNIIKRRKPRISAMTDMYIIRLDRVIGTAKDKPTNIINVYANSNTKQIVTMYPILDYVLPQDEVEYEEEIISIDVPRKLEYKRESQIEKFNRKYNKE